VEEDLMGEACLSVRGGEEGGGAGQGEELGLGSGRAGEKKRKNGSRGRLVAGRAERERRRGEGEGELEKGEVLGCQREGEKSWVGQKKRERKTLNKRERKEQDHLKIKSFQSQINFILGVAYRRSL
jgi:hypothetical protein